MAAAAAVAEAMPPEAASALTAIASPCRKTATATLSGPGTGRNRGGISPCLEPASDSTVAPTTPTPYKTYKKSIRKTLNPLWGRP